LQITYCLDLSFMEVIYQEQLAWFIYTNSKF